MNNDKQSRRISIFEKQKNRRAGILEKMFCKKNMVVLHNNRIGNNYVVANIIANYFGCAAVAAEENPNISDYKIVVVIVSNTGDEEISQPMEDYLFNLKDTNKKYLVCELGNYFGFESYSGCKKVVFKILNNLGWIKMADVSLDSLPKLDIASLENWLVEAEEIIKKSNFRVFVDGGGHHRSSVEGYIKNFQEFQRVYVFEANPIFYDSYNGSKFILVKKAIWINDCKLPFYVSKDHAQIASSLLEEKLCKVDGRLVPSYFHKSIEVECVDFSEWIKTNIDRHWDLTLKLDIEGAEYDVLWKLIKDGTISYVRKLFVEFHHETVKSKKFEHDKLVSELNNLGIVPQYWD